jgi:VRR-NUC domain
VTARAAAAGRTVALAIEAYAAYETAEAITESAEMAKHMKELADKVQASIGEALEFLQKEIDVKSSTFAAVDKGGDVTVAQTSRELAQNRKYITVKIPFRPIISQVCTLAMQIPIVAPRTITKKLPNGLLEKVDIMTYLNQTTASLVFEAMDATPEWHSPLKAEPVYDGQRAYVGEPNINSLRVNDLFPFWPRPGGTGTNMPDLLIVEHRKETFETGNIYALVEIKFPKDWVRKGQMESYVDVTNNPEKVALLRVPEDCVGFELDPTDHAGKHDGSSSAPKRRK